MEWLKKLQYAIDYIEENLDKEIFYDEAARIACCSTYYFQRMFTYITGITLSEYIRRRRMTAAAFELQATNVKIMDLALKYGYTSPTAFNRAFQNVHNVSPSTARNYGISLNAYPRISFSIFVTGGESMKYKIEEKNSFRIVGVRTHLKEDMDYNFEVVPKFWQSIIKDECYSKICNLNSKIPNTILGVSSYEGKEDIYYYIAASTDEDTPKDMFEYEIPKATWVVFESDGPFKESIQLIFKRFLTEWLPFSNYEYANLPDIEVYPISNNASCIGYSQVWIAIKKVN